MNGKQSKAIRKAREELRKEADKLRSSITHDQKVYFINEYNKALCSVKFKYRLLHCIKVMLRRYAK